MLAARVNATRFLNSLTLDVRSSLLSVNQLALGKSAKKVQKKAQCAEKSAK